MEINCKKCKNNCCGDIEDLAPILIPFEEKRFEKYAKEVEAPYRNVFLLKRKKNGKCVFFDEKNRNCSIYEERPIECRIYPYLIDFKKFKFNIKLDGRFCGQSNLAKSEEKKIIDQLKKIKFPKNWIKASQSKIIQEKINAINHVTSK